MCLTGAVLERGFHMNFVRLKNVDNLYWNKIWPVYQNSFPIFEKRKIEDHIAAMGDDEFYCTVIFEDNILIGFLFYWQWDKYQYIEHFAIIPSLRGKNYGSRILKEFCKDDKIIILEIDPPVDDISIRRLRFYKRLGFQLNNYTHVQLTYRKNYEGYKLKILSYNCILSEEEYNDFNNFLFNEISQYGEGQGRNKEIG